MTPNLTVCATKCKTKFTKLLIQIARNAIKDLRYYSGDIVDLVIENVFASKTHYHVLGNDGLLHVR